MVIIQGVGIWGIVFIGEGSRFLRDIPQQTRFRSVPDVMDTKFAAPLLAELLIKCQRLPRVCLRYITEKSLLFSNGAVTL